MAVTATIVQRAGLRASRERRSRPEVLRLLAADAISVDAPIPLESPSARLGSAVRVLGRAAAWARERARDGAVMVVLSCLVGVVHGWGMARYPAFFDDEGTYVAQAWAIDHLHLLAPYTYWYDHPPLGWIVLAGWSKLAPTFGSHAYAVGSARAFMLVLTILSANLLYLFGTRMGLRRSFAALGVLLFTLSPLAVHYQRMVLLDNIAVCWMLAAFVLALTPKRRLSAYAASGACLAGAALTKETFVLVFPALALLVWQRSAGPTRRFALGVFAALFAFVAAFYPLFALLRGELLAGPGHTSLADGVKFQLTRTGGGSVLDPHSGTRVLMHEWLARDPVLLAAAMALVPLGAVIARLRPLALGLGIPVAMMLRPGGYVPAMYVIIVLPFAALLVAAVVDWLWRPRAVARAAARWRGRACAGAATLLACGVIVGLAVVAAPRWADADAAQMHRDDAGASRAAVDWLALHASREATVLVDDTIWVDLVERGFKPTRTVWFYKLDLDPAIRIPWYRFDYVVRSNIIAGNLYWLPQTKRVVDHSRPVAVFTSADERIEIRRLIKPQRTNSVAKSHAPDTASG